MKIRLCLLGRPGSGKGTVSKLLLESFKDPSIRYYNVGGILREQASQDSHIRQIHAAGGLVNSDRVLGIFEDALSQDQFILDGSPRKSFEAEFILNHSLWRQAPGCLVYLDLDMNLAKQRLLARGRFDDTEETISKRFDDYSLETVKSIDKFKQANSLIVVNANNPPEEVCANIIKALCIVC